MSRVWPRLWTALVASLVVLLALPGVPARAEGTDEAVTAAGTWLATKSAPVADVDQAADRLLGLAAAGVPQEWVDDAATQLEFLLGRTPDRSSAALAHAIVALDVAGRDPRTVGGKDLVGELAVQVGTGAALPGQLPAEPGTEITTQAWGVLALHRTGALPPAAVDFLARQRCGNGAVVFGPTDATCAQSVSVVDQGLALAALAAVQQSGGSHGDAVTGLVGWFAGQRAADGTWPRLAASGLSWAAAALQRWGSGDEAAAITRQLVGLQVRADETTTASLVGSVAETAELKQDFLQHSLPAGASTTAAALVGLRGLDLGTYRYAVAGTWGTLTARPVQALALPPTITRGNPVTVLVTGFEPGETVAGYVGDATDPSARGTADSAGVVLELGTDGLSSGEQRVRVEGPGGRSGSVTIGVVDPPGVAPGQESRPGGAASTDPRLPQLGWPAFVGVVAVVVGGLFLSARLLRPRAG